MQRWIAIASLAVALLAYVVHNARLDGSRDARITALEGRFDRMQEILYRAIELPADRDE